MTISQSKGRKGASSFSYFFSPAKTLLSPLSLVCQVFLNFFLNNKTEETDNQTEELEHFFINKYLLKLI